jgi:serine/threonine protein kinase
LGGVEVAVKEVRYPLDRPESKRELAALELIKTLRHPYLLAVHDFWVENERLYISMELADGTLAQMAAKRKEEGIPPKELLQLFEEAAETLDFLHRHRVLHRDIKPANLLLLGGHMKVADLGLAKHNPDSVAFSHTLAGTPVYMAPETFANEFRAESDQYALALCYAELRLGRRVCVGNNMASVMTWHLSEVPRLDGLRPHEERAVRRALSKKPTERFKSCLEFARALRELEPQPPRPPQGKSWKSALALLGAVSVLLLIAWGLWHAGRGPTTPPGPQVDWDPRQHGFVVPADAQITTAGSKRYYDRMVKEVGKEQAVFLLIPHNRPDDPQTFYMMENKVSNALFKSASEDAAFRESLAKYPPRYPRLKWGEWCKGGMRNGEEDLLCDRDDLPVLRVNAIEAYCFAQLLGGKLPLADQWDAAAGKGTGALAPFRDPAAPLMPGEVGVDRRAEGPMPVGTAKRDISPLGCKDMSGNGAEWTRNLAGGGQVPPDVTPGKELDRFLLVIVRGQRYYKKEPFHFADAPDKVLFTNADPAVGFRVVVEPE